MSEHCLGEPCTDCSHHCAEASALHRVLRIQLSPDAATAHAVVADRCARGERVATGAMVQAAGACAIARAAERGKAHLTNNQKKSMAFGKQ